MEFEDEHDEEQEEEEDEDEITIPPLPTPSSASVPPSYDLLANSVGSTPPSRPHRVTDRIRSSVVRYRECLKNHAVNIGGHAVDGCGEFMPAGVEGTLDALKCAACNCHRNFHRKETDVTAETLITTTPHHNHVPPPHQPLQPLGPPLYPQFSAYYRTPAPASGSHQYRPLAALPSTSGGTQSGDDMSHPSSSGGEGRRESGGGMMMVPKKRFRTKFSQEQKDKMLEFAEKLGWRIQKHDESAVQQFCAEVQVKRQVLKVWMHNNKHTLGKKP